jgi:pilus assembly protein CpaB
MKKLMLCAFLFAIVSAFFAYLYMSDLEIRYKNMDEPVKVVVAMQKISQGTIIESYMITEKNIPKEYVQPKAFQGIKELFSEDETAMYISLNTIEVGEQILSTKISKTNQDIGISSLIPDGKKALSINFDMEVLNVLTPGSRLDIFSIMEYVDINKEFQESVFLIAQNILVLAVGNNYIGSPKKQDEELENARAVTLAVSIEEAQKIFLALERGSIRYVMRPTGDIEYQEMQPLKLSSMIKDVSKTVNHKNYAKDSNFINHKEVLDIINKYSRISGKKIN